MGRGNFCLFMFWFILWFYCKNTHPYTLKYKFKSKLKENDVLFCVLLHSLIRNYFVVVNVSFYHHIYFVLNVFLLSVICSILLKSAVGSVSESVIQFVCYGLASFHLTLQLAAVLLSFIDSFLCFQTIHVNRHRTQPYGNHFSLSIQFHGCGCTPLTVNCHKQN